MDEVGIGEAFSAYGIGYFISSPVILIAALFLSNRSTVILGVVFGGVSVLVMGPSQLLNFAPSFILTYSGLLASGIFSGMINTPVNLEIVSES